MIGIAGMTVVTCLIHLRINLMLLPPKYQVLRASPWFSRSETAFLFLSCHSSACPNLGVLAKENLPAAVQTCGAPGLHR